MLKYNKLFRPKRLCLIQVPYSRWLLVASIWYAAGVLQELSGCQMQVRRPNLELVRAGKPLFKVQTSPDR